MAQDSKTKKFNRRLRREKTLVYKMLDGAIAQREQAKMYVNVLQEMLQKYIEKYGPPEQFKTPEPVEAPPVDPDAIPAFEAGSVTKELQETDVETSEVNE